jgi:hypothetical protein
MKSTSSGFFACCLALAVALMMVGCQATKTSPPPAVVSVSLNQSSVSMAVGTTKQFTATVQNTTNTAVTWSVDSTAGGNPSVGTISASGLYTSPSQPGTHTVTATSVADTTKDANATVNVSSISVSPASAIVSPGATQQFSASIQGSSNISVTWSVDQVMGGNSSVGTINLTGLYTAPSQTGTHTITAASAADSTLTASASISVATISLSPAAVTVTSSASQQFTATVQGASNAAITWSVDNIAGGNAAVGAISATGIYTAPSQLGSHTVTAACTANTSISASAGLTVFLFTLSYPSLVIAPSAQETFTATIQGLSNTSVTWSVDGIAGGNSTTGTITSNGLYSAPFALGAHSITATSVGNPSSSVSGPLTIDNYSPGGVLTYHNDDARDGAFLEETQLTPSNVNSTQFGKLFSYAVDGQIYAQPLYLEQINIAGTLQDVVFVVTQNNSVYAFDATGKQTTPLWQINLGPSVTKNDYSGVSPVVGILSTPVIDATTSTMYLVAETAGASTPFWLHALDVTTGAEKLGGPVAVTGTVPGTGLDSSGGNITLETDCYQRMGLALNPVTNAIYIPFGSCNHGWVLAYNKTTLKQTAIFNDTPDGGGGGLWASGGAPAIDDTTGDLYLMSGADAGDQNFSQLLYNDSFLRLDPANLSVLDFFTPDDNYTLAQNDADLGSGSNILLPGSSLYPHETLGGGKDGNVFVVNRDSMGSFNSSANNVVQSVHTGVKQYNNIFSTPVYWNGFVYYHPNADVLHAFSWSNGLLSQQPVSSGTIVYQMHGATASLSANNASNGIIWDIDNSNYNGTGTGSGPCVLHAYDATNVASELYNSSQAGSRDTAGAALKFTVPTITGGKVYVPTANELDVYGLLGH